MSGATKAKKPTGISTTTKVGAGFGVALLLVLTWAWWPSPAPQFDEASQKALDAIKNDKNANPPVADVPPPTDGPRRKAIKSK